MNQRHFDLPTTILAVAVLVAAVIASAAAQEPAVPDRPANVAKAPSPQPSAEGRESKAPSPQPSPKGRGSESPSGEEIAQWIADLDSGRYQVRERATQNLLGTGQLALDTLLATANGDRPEPADRAVWILRQLADTEDMDERRAVLERLVQLENRPDVIAEARQALGQIRHALAVEAISRLGGRFLSPGADVPWGQVLADCLLLDDGWRGGDAGLKYLRDVRDVPMIAIIGTDISPEGFAGLKLTDSVQWLWLYGTRLDEAEAERLRGALPGVQIDYRRGALLGVRGSENQGAAVVQTVQAGTAAAAAGIRPRDIIRKFDGQPVARFSELTERIAKCRPGDEVTLEIQRAEKKLEVKVKLGRWKSL